MNYLNKIAELLKIRPRVEVFLYDKDGRVLASKSQDSHDSSNSSSKTWKFPGGGIEGTSSVNETARREALEEAGVTIRGVHEIDQAPVYTEWPDHFRISNKKQKGRDFDGQRTHFRAGRVHSRDTSLLGHDNDSLKGADMVPIDRLIKDLRSASGDSSNKYRVFDREKLTGLLALKATLKRKGLR
jgi:8-oxo-dGTP pyrophosphatase MutT (NUDIX family)